MNDIRNITIIAHVDHGKTTLVDALLKQSKTKLHKNTAESLIMDSNELERERGITIFSKNASVMWKGTKINIIDTPGHADFGGEVERVLKMADGSLLLVDAKEGPMPQTRFVLGKALELGHKIIVVINKIDKADARINYALDKTLELFLELGADDSIADFPIVFASAKNGVAGLTENQDMMTDISPLFDEIIRLIPPPSGDKLKPLQLAITSFFSDPHKGRIAVGRIYNGFISKNQEVMHIARNGTLKKYRLTSLMTFSGLERIEIDSAVSGDIIAVSGIPQITIGDTIADVNSPEALPIIAIEEPTMKMTFMVNNSPFAGTEGQFKTSREIRERLYQELQNDVALGVEDRENGSWEVSGRGELHLAIFIERVRREGYEFQVGKPQVINKLVNGKLLTPFERIFITVPEEYSGIVMQKLGARRAELQDMKSAKSTVSMEFIISADGLFGYRSEFVTDTRGLGVINTNFYKYMEHNGYTYKREQGSLVAHESGITSLYGLTNVQDRGILFIQPGTRVYQGQIIGQNARSEDMRVNVCKTKLLTNMRSKGEGVMEHFNTPRLMNLENALEFIAEDELVEVTPENIRMRKIILDEVEERRKRSQGIA